MSDLKHWIATDGDGDVVNRWIRNTEPVVDEGLTVEEVNDVRDYI